MDSQKRRETRLWYILGTCAAGVLLNFLGNWLNNALGLPFYLDTIGTILVALVGGYLPAIVVGWVTNLLNGFSDIINIYYGSFNALIGVMTAYLAGKGYWKNPLKALLTVPLLAVVGGGLGSVLTWCLYGLSIDPGTGLAFRILETGMPAFVSQLTADVLLDLIDKLITVLAASAIIHVVPEKWRGRFRPEGRKQPAEARAFVEHGGVIAHSLQTRVLLVLSASILVLAAGTTTVFGFFYHNTLLAERETLCYGAATLAAEAINPDMVDAYIAEGEKAIGYRETERMLTAIRDNTPDVEYIYVYRILPDGCHVVFDVDTGEVEGASPGEIIPFDESFDEYLPALLAGETIEPLVTDDTFGWLMTVYQPVYDANGVCQCYAAADISMDRLQMNEVGFLARVVSIFLSVFMASVAIAFRMANRHIIHPINAMTLAAEDFAYDTEKARAESVQRFRQLDIQTGDEIETLYHVVGKTMDDTVRYIEDVQSKTETISRMQNGLIMVLADLVESRDKCTGDHIRKTAAYAGLIMRHMRALGIYSDRITDEFYDDVVNSAPLHDVGKIHVSDTILNKPGKLTDEEFEIMKTHTTAGGEVIEQAIETVGDGMSGYLEEARNLATYHHERWDGKGYPTGLAGEEIPLSARIMSVADVFDALVSRRSYKEPFPFEKAMDIIREGAGTQFDPEVVRAFVDASDEARAISEQFMGK